MNCDGIAPYYRWFEYAGFGGALQHRRCGLLGEIREARRVLVLGDGDGRFLERLIAEVSGREGDPEIESIEASARMQALARRRTGDRVHHRLGDARTVPLPRGRYDVLVTHFFLDCFDAADAPKLVERLAESATPRARWLISEFRQAPQGWRSVWSGAWLWSLYLFFGVTTGLKTRALVDHHPLLARHGFRLVRQESSRWGLLVSELWVR